MDGVVHADIMDDPVRHALALSDEKLGEQWTELKLWVRAKFGREAGVESVLFLIGIQSSGIGYSPKLAKEHKQDLIMRGTYEALATLNLYERANPGAGDEPEWRRTSVHLPDLSVDEQEKLLKIGVLRYFRPHLDHER